MVDIIEILGRSEQGVTRPYKCRGEDDQIYFVKGIGAGRSSQVYEYVAGSLGRILGLPIAPFGIIHVPEELVLGNSDYSDLGYGPVFGSVRQLITELNYAGIEHVPYDLQAAVLAFDWWIKNEDRLLTESGGNPNLFWEPGEEKLVIIDHNQAFDPTFDPENFKENHVFSCQVNNVFGDAVFQEEQIARFKSALGALESTLNELPEEWSYLDVEMTIKANFSKEDIINILERCNNDGFWVES